MIEIIACVVGLAIALALSWGVTVGIIKLITICFGCAFSLPVATGIWLILLLLRWVATGERRE